MLLDIGGRDIARLDDLCDEIECIQVSGVEQVFAF